jgi:hypothetical protein
VVKEAIYCASPRYVRISISHCNIALANIGAWIRDVRFASKKRTYSAVRINVRYVQGTDIYRRKARQGPQSYASEGTKGGPIAFST